MSQPIEPRPSIKAQLALDLYKAMIDLAPQLALEPSTLEALIERPKDETHGDFALPLFRYGKATGLSPGLLAQKLAEKLNSMALPWLAEAQALTAFLNLRLKPYWVAENILPSILNGDFFKELRTSSPVAGVALMVEYSQPNTHKQFHVGHLRNTVLGDTLWRLFEYLGAKVTPVNYIGDEGTHIAKCLWQIKRSAEKAPTEGQAEWLGEMYRLSNEALQSATPGERTQFEGEISNILNSIESKAGDDYELWRTTRQWSLDSFQEIYQWLGARFDRFFYESEVSEDSQSIVTEFLNKGIFTEDQGAIGADLKGAKLGFLILRKRDGNTLYATKDLALARLKFETYGVDQSVYVVGMEQTMHFKQVFKTLECMGFEQAKKCYHLSYGHVVLPDGKMSSRKGNDIGVKSLRAELESELQTYLAKYKDSWPAEELARTQHKLCVGAVRYGMLCSDPSKEIVFRLADWLSFEGDTGPYLMYALARIKSILRKAEELGMIDGGPQDRHYPSAEEAQMLRRLSDFNEVVASAAATYKPSVLTHHLFSMAKTFNRFHHEVPVLKTEDPDLRRARLDLLRAYALTLDKGLHLLGIDAPERM